jgi:hypothetical protein
MDALRAELQREFQATIDALRSEILSLRTNQSRPKPCLLDPEKFNGQAHKFDT